MNGINYLNSWLEGYTPNFPSEFEKATTYYEVMKECYHKMHECLHYLMEHEKQMEELTKQIAAQMIGASEARTNKKINALQADLEAIIKQQISMVQSAISSLAGSMERFELETNDRFLQFFSGQESLTNVINQEIQKIYNQLSEDESAILQLESNFNTFKDHVNGMFAAELENLSTKIDEQLARMQGDRILVTNPITGNREGLYSVLQQLAQAQNPYPITADQFNALHITADEFNARNIRAIDFNNWAGLIFFKDSILPPLWEKIQSLEGMIEVIQNEKWASIVSGDLLKPYEAYKELGTMFLIALYQPIRASAFDSLNLTADEFNAKNITARMFNLYGMRDNTPDPENPVTVRGILG